MTEVFISYAEEDRQKAAALAEILESRGWSTFFDVRIPPGAEWAEMLQQKLESAGCMIVLWSKDSVKSLWVRAEASEGYERRMLVPVSLDRASPPRLFRGIQTASLQGWNGGPTEQLENVLKAIEARIGGPAFQGLENVSPEGAVTPESLALIHSSWRREDQDAKFPGRRMYQIHVIVYGNKQVLDRIESVTYRLAGYPPDHTVQKAGPRSRNFELKELAWGWSLIRADVRVRDQPEGRENPIRLYRFVNVTETGPRLADEFM